MTEKLLDNDFAQVTTMTLSQGTLSQSNSEPLEGLSISHAHCKAKVSLYGGQVLSFKPTGQQEVLWLSEQASYQSGKAIRGGIPLCWPWFGENDKQAEDDKSVKHGFARQLPWQLAEVKADEDGVTLILILKGEKQHRLWPNAYVLRQTLFFGKSLKQTLAMSNLSQEDAHYSAALHSYFRVSNPGHVNIDTLTGLNYDDKLSSSSSIQQRAVSCIGEIDRVYHSGAAMSIVDAQWQRKIEISSDNCQQWVLWNPGAELANTMTDIHPGGEQEYVCLEAANTKWHVIPAGETVIISQEITVSTLG
ncbi:D-hexose-6-phosphate mutarotase [Colwellia piezophila]|uniref:D-hexose-6-phosphate mutarotase n=1 Tax=Colwellia piezophila TaxID=211668 RepID=UPI0003721389|nr:D-hexose-6-phosphate mutarotase [Colwellia piezophila]